MPIDKIMHILYKANSTRKWYIRRGVFCHLFVVAHAMGFLSSFEMHLLGKFPQVLALLSVGKQDWKTTRLLILR
jgi:hypothetical protein